jgi:acyl-CoA synthetase (AMP-forming)/AMP-acid ligase II
VGVADPRWGEVVTGCVIAAANVTADELDVFCRGSSLANYKRPRAYLLLDELPRNAVGKIMRRQLRGKAAEAGLAGRMGVPRPSGGGFAFRDTSQDAT